MKIIKPHALKKGDIIGICAPASAPNTKENLQRGIKYLEHLGYHVKLGKNLSQRHGYLAGTDKQRAADLNNFFADREVKAIFVARGGYGSHRILPILNYSLIEKHPKIFVGYSDITALQLALFTKTGLVTFSGPMVASNLGMKLNVTAEESFWRTLTSPTIPAPLVCPENLTQSYLAGKTSIGRMLGGNMSLVAALVGTGYFPFIHDIILLLEEIDERPYRIDRLLQQIRLGGILNRSKGIALGQFVGCVPGRGKPSLTLSQVFQEVFATFRYPVLGGIHYGHIKNPLTIPIGILSRLNTRSSKIEFLEAPVQK